MLFLTRSHRTRPSYFIDSCVAIATGEKDKPRGTTSENKKCRKYVNYLVRGLTFPSVIDLGLRREKRIMGFCCINKLIYFIAATLLRISIKFTICANFFFILPDEWIYQSVKRNKWSVDAPFSFLYSVNNVLYWVQGLCISLRQLAHAEAIGWISGYSRPWAARNRPCESTSFLPLVTSSVLIVKDNFVR